MYTDRKPLTYALPSASEHSPGQARHLSFIAEFTSDIQYICGKHNEIADARSRIQAVTTPPIDLYQLAVDQTNFEKIEAYHASITGLESQDVPFQDVSLLCDVSLGRPRPVVPRSWTYRVFEVVHFLADPGPRPTQRGVADRFVWHDIRRWCNECNACQTAKIQRHTRAPISSRTPLAGRFLSLHVDLVGPLRPSEGMTYLFTITDRFTRWPEAIPIPYAKVSTCAKALTRHWIARFGVPEDVTLDCGAQLHPPCGVNSVTLLGFECNRLRHIIPKPTG